MNEPYKSIYEALPDHKSLKATKNKTEIINTSTGAKFDKLKNKENIKKVETYIKSINSLINKFTNSFTKTNAKKLKIGDMDGKFLSWKVSVFPRILYDYDDVSPLIFLPTQEKIRSRIIELFTELSDFIDTENTYNTGTPLPEKYKNFRVIVKQNDWVSKGSMERDFSDFDDLIKQWEEIGITPASDYAGVQGLYRLHATSAPPVCLKGQYTGKAGIGLLMYKGFIHYCGHGYTSTQSKEAKNVWISIKKDSNIISFEYEDYRGLIAISTLLPKQNVIQILDRFITQTQTGDDYSSFYDWCKYRMDEGDTLEDILDNELYALIENDIDKIKAGVLQSERIPIEGESEEEYDDEYNNEIDIDSLGLHQIFDQYFDDRSLKSYIELFREDELQNMIDMISEDDDRENISDEEIELEAREQMLDTRIVQYWNDATGESLYDAYINYLQRIIRITNLTSILKSSVSDLINIEDLLKDGMYYDTISSKFDNRINEIEISVIREEQRDLSQSNNSNTKQSNSDTNVFDIVDSEDEAKQKVNISNLIWKDEEENEDNPEEMLEMTINEAIKNTPSGYRLPTIQELYTQIRKQYWGFNSDFYWTSSRTSDVGFWFINNNTFKLIVAMDRNIKCSVRYVKDV